MYFMNGLVAKIFINDSTLKLIESETCRKISKLTNVSINTKTDAWMISFWDPVVSVIRK